MCGISIIINKRNAQVLPETIRKMNDKVIHRGPDDEGYYYGDCFAFGHRRLSVVDTSAAGHQPMQKDDDCIVYNGMLYNYIEIRYELQQAGYSFTSQTDTEVILAAYQHWNVEAFKKFNGMWAIGIYDKARQMIVLCRDHFGIKPLYYTTFSDSFAASSEIKQFTAIPGFTPVLNTVVAINFLAKGLLNYSDETFFNGVQSLAPGHYLQYNLQTHQASVHEWYNLKKSISPVTDNLEQAIVELRRLFQSSLQLRMRADVKVGSCLSGGIDSSSMVSMLHAGKIADEAFTTVTSCYTDKMYDEQQYSDIITKQTGFSAVKVFPDLQQLFSAGHFDTMLYHQDQPFSSASHYAEFNVFKAARENNITVMLDGQGSDEYLCGYPDFFSMYIREQIWHGQFRKVLRAVYAKGQHEKGSAGVIKELMKSLVLYPLATLAKKVMGKAVYPWMSNEAKIKLKDERASFKANDVRSLSLQQVVYSSVPYQLHSEDRNSMLFAIESRLPFLDHRLVEYAIALPSDFKINKGYSKYILRNALPELPEKVRWRKDKLGFAAPDKDWVLANNELVRKELVRAVKYTPFFTEQLLARFDRFVKGQLGYEPVYFRAMALNRFCRIFNMQFQ